VTTTEAAPADLLVVARHLLARTGSGGELAAGVWPRSAAVLARQALEQSLTSLWRQRGLDLAAASARAQLLCLEEYLGGTELAPESDRGSNVFGQGCDGPAPLAGGALVHGQHA
jgi:hypothetical protein